VLDDLSRLPPRASARKHHCSLHLAILATNPGESSGLDPLVEGIASKVMNDLTRRLPSPGSRKPGSFQSRAFGRERVRISHEGSSQKAGGAIVEVFSCRKRERRRPCGPLSNRVGKAPIPGGTNRANLTTCLAHFLGARFPALIGTHDHRCGIGGAGMGGTHRELVFWFL
jgi:hypothetical protein